MSGPNIVSFPLDQMPRVRDNKEVLFEGISKLNWFDTIIYYVIDSDARKAVNLKNWYGNWAANHTPLELPTFGHHHSDVVALECTKWVARTIKYTGDTELWRMKEKWMLPDETLRLKKGDCEDGAILLYYLLRYHGFSDHQVRVVAGDVRGGGHAYVSYISEQTGVEYVLDWCYWPSDSLVVPYGLNDNYFRGQREWFSFNRGGAYQRR